jgi:hypothetical protein
MTLVDKLIPYYVRFQWGYSYVSLVMTLVGFAVSIITMLTVKGIYVPLWAIGLIGSGIMLFCSALGTFTEKKDIQNRITSHSNQNANPEFQDIFRKVTKTRDDVELIKKHLGIQDE